MRAWILALEPGDGRRVGRTRRALMNAGLAGDAVFCIGDLVARLSVFDEPALLIEAGAWFLGKDPLPSIPASATGKALIALGAVRDEDAAHERAGRWRATMQNHGGDFDAGGDANLPAPACAYLEVAAARRLASFLQQSGALETAWAALLAQAEFRKIHLPVLDVRESAALRVLQVITTIQLGGAERVALDLALELSRRGVAVAVAALGRPTRAAFAEPPDFYDLSQTPSEAVPRAEAIAGAARDFGADIIHAHLLTAAEMRALRAHGWPLVMTLHNTQEAWPQGIAEDEHPADLILACSQAVEAQAASVFRAPVRTVWNGIEPAAARGRGLRGQIGWSVEDFVVVVVANPRRQKRLDRLPSILVELQRLLGRRKARLFIAGAPARGSADAEGAASVLAANIRASPARASIHWPGARQDVADVLATGDVMLSVSAHEGLSLAHLEALAAGLPVVATDVGGAREVAAQSAGLLLLSRDDADSLFARILAAFARRPRKKIPAFPASFTRSEMAARTGWLYPRLLSRKDSSADGLWLITNNFSTGGAQSSARRLLTGLAQRGVKVRAAVVEEHPAHPTPGRAALLQEGIPVVAVPPDDAAAGVLAAIEADPPRAVLFWNLSPVIKILLADALFDVPIFDVSPGEMFFASLARYFANPRVALPYRSPREYGQRLAGVVVKYAAEAERAAATLGAPVHVIRNGVALDELPRVSAREGPLVLGTVARLSPAKRIGDLLDAVRIASARLPPFTLRIAGGPERGFEKHADELCEQAHGLPVEWCGELPDARAFLAGLDFFVMISEPSGCPNASLEAMAAGVPVIATEVGGAGEQVVDGVTGLLTPGRNAETLAEAIVRFAKDPMLRESCTQAARERIRAEFSLERMLDGYAGLCGLEVARAD